MGVGYMLIADFDVVELSNLSRGVLFRKNDVRYHRSKAEIVARRAKAIHVMPQAHVQPFHGDIVWQMGRGVFRRVDVVIGCLDNVEARMAVNAACLFTGTPYIDGGIRGLAGTVTAVLPPATACWECTTTAAERAHSADRYDYSCSKVMRRDLESGRAPTIQVASSIIAGFQTQEAVKVIQGQPWAAGYMIEYHASGKRPDLDVVAISRRPGCWCQQAKAIEEVIELPLSALSHTLEDLLNALHQRGIPDAQIALPGSFVVGRYCTTCKRTDSIMKPAFALDTGVVFCHDCQIKSEKVELLHLEYLHPASFDALDGGQIYRDRMMKMRLIDLGFPPLALVWFSSSGMNGALESVAELSADAANVMGGQLYAGVRSRQFS